MAVINVAKGQDWTARVRILADEFVVLSREVLDGETSLPVKELAYAFANGDKLLFGRNRIVTVTATAVPGDTSITIAALNGGLARGAVGTLISAIAGADIEMEVSIDRNDVTEIIAYQGTVIDDALDQHATKSKLVEFVGIPADFVGDADGNYYFAIWRRNVSNIRPILDGDFNIISRNFITA
jgi:hypothetical protein